MLVGVHGLQANTRERGLVTAQDQHQDAADQHDDKHFEAGGGQAGRHGEDQQFHHPNRHEGRQHAEHPAVGEGDGGDEDRDDARGQQGDLVLDRPQEGHGQGHRGSAGEIERHARPVKTSAQQQKRHRDQARAGDDPDDIPVAQDAGAERASPEQIAQDQPQHDGCDMCQHQHGHQVCGRALLGTLDARAGSDQALPQRPRAVLFQAVPPLLMDLAVRQSIRTATATNSLACASAGCLPIMVPQLWVKRSAFCWQFPVVALILADFALQCPA